MLGVLRTDGDGGCGSSFFFGVQGLVVSESKVGAASTSAGPAGIVGGMVVILIILQGYCDHQARTSDVDGQRV